MTANKSTSNVLGVNYSIADAYGNEVVVANGQPVLTLPLQPTVPGTPTAALYFNGMVLRLTQANASAWPYSAGQSFTSAVGDQVSFVTGPSVYAGGSYDSPGGLRMYAKGVFVDFTTGNMADLATPLNAFGSAGVVS